MADNLAVDGQAVATNASFNNMTSTSDSALLNQIAELKRKVERKDNEIRRQGKELSISQKEVIKLQKDSRKMAIEMEDYRRRNEGLQKSLANSRLLTAEARDEAQKKQDMSKARELEDALLKAKHKQLRTDEELEGSRAENVEIEKLLNTIRIAKNKSDDELEEKIKDIDDLSLKLKALQVLSGEKDGEIDRQRSEVLRIKSSESQLIKDLSNEREQNSRASKQIEELMDEAKILRRSLEVRNETNQVLKGQLDDVNNKKFILTEEEFKELKKLEQDAHKFKARNRDLVKSVEMHMSLLEQSENKNTLQKDELDSLKDKFSELQRNYDSLKASAGTSDTAVRTLKKEVNRLRQEVKDYEDNAEQFRLDPLARDAEVANIRSGMVNLVRTRQEEIEAKKDERKHRKAAEDAARAMRSRISFLLDQIDQASKLVVSWQEEKALFQSELSALQKSNLTLRSRLMQLQKSFVSRQITEAAGYEYAHTTGILDKDISPGKKTLGYHHTGSELAHILTQAGTDSDARLITLDGNFNNPASETLPMTPEAIIERNLMDVVCAFESGIRGEDLSKLKVSSGKKSKPKHPLKGNLRAYIGDDGMLAIGLEGSKGTTVDIESDVVEAEELMNGLQIHAFLRFSQSRHDGKVTALFTEKIASILNFVRKLMAESSLQLGVARKKLAISQSKLTVSSQRSLRMKDRVIHERVSKQKMMMKYLREQIRQSDFRVTIDTISKSASDQLNDLEESTGGLAARETELSRGVLRQLLDVSGELSKVGVSSGTTTGPPGAMELRMTESLIDDETVHGMMELLRGNLTKLDGDDGDNDGGTTSGTLNKTLLSVSGNYLNRILLLNLRSNQITDLACKSIAPLVENSPNLRMLDLRSNLISPKGTRVLFDATRRNSSVMYVTQRQGGFMIEGHRDIVGQKGKNSTNSHEDKENFGKLVGDVKHPLRIDIRNNASGPEALEGLVEALGGKMSSEGEAADNPPETTLDNSFNDTNTSTMKPGKRSGRVMPDIDKGTWTNEGIIDGVREDFRRGREQGSSRPASASVPRRSTTVLKNTTESRPASALLRKSTSELKVGIGSAIEPTRTGRINTGIDDLIERSQDRKDERLPIGSLLDTQIRSLQGTPNAAAVLETTNSDGLLIHPPAGSMMSGKFRNKVVMDTYNNAMNSLKSQDQTPKDVNPITLVERGAKSQGPSKKPSIKDRTKALMSRTSNTPKKLNSGSSTNKKLRPMSASAASRSVKKNSSGNSNSAYSLLNNLHSLNPGVLF